MKTRIATVLAALAALVATVARADTVTNIYTNVTYKANVEYALKPVTNTVSTKTFERNGKVSFRSDGVLCVNTTTDKVDLRNVPQSYVIVAALGDFSYTNVSGFVGIYAKDFSYASPVGPDGSPSWSKFSNNVFTSTVEYASFQSTPFISMHCEADAFNFYLNDDAMDLRTVFGTNGLHTVTNVSMRAVWKDSDVVIDVLVPSITYTPVKQVGTNIFVNGINVTR